MTILIYCLKDSTGAVFYVGRTNNSGSRLGNHRKRFGADISMHILETCCGRVEASSAECRWISHFVDSGIVLQNKILASVGSWIEPEHVRELHSARLKDLWRDAEYRQKMSAASKASFAAKRDVRIAILKENYEKSIKSQYALRIGHTMRKTAEHARKISVAQKGKPRPWTPAGAERVRSTQFPKGHIPWKKGRRIVQPPSSVATQFKKGMKPWNTGKHHSPETIAKIRASKLGRIPWNKGLRKQKAIA